MEWKEGKQIPFVDDNQKGKAQSEDPGCCV
jgi:hypothetical protein